MRTSKNRRDNTSLGPKIRLPDPTKWFLASLSSPTEARNDELQRILAIKKDDIFSLFLTVRTRVKRMPC